MRLTYTAKNTDGEEYERTINTDSRFDVYKRVRSEGGIVVSIREEREWNFFDLERLNAITERIKESDIILMAKNLGAMIEAGLPLSRGLSVLERQTKNRKLKKVFSSIAQDIQMGNNLHTALAKFPKIFSSLMISMVSAGEESGKLGESLKTIGEQMEKTYLLKRKIRGALIYPSIIIIVLVGVGVLMLLFVVPILTETFEELEVELPKSTQVVVVVSEFLTNNTVLSFALFFGVIVSFAAAIRTRQGRRAYEFMLLHTPLIKTIVREVNAARMARTFSSLLSAGVEVVTALTITHNVVQNSYFKEILDEAKNAVQKGNPISDVFSSHSNLYPILVGEMISVGEETGKLPEMLIQLAGFYENEVEQRTKNISTVIEPVLMVVVGTIVGFFALSMISPIYSLSSSI